MTLQEKIHVDLKTAMKSGDTFKRDVLRFLESAMKNAAIEKKLEREALSDDVVIETLRRALKQRKDSIEQYRLGGRSDLVEKEERESLILKEYLPAGLSEETVRVTVRRVIAEMGATTPADFGKVMGKAMQSLGSEAEGEVVKKIVQEALANL